jgi:hypothetical protein
MVENSELAVIKKELQTLRHLYKKIAEHNIPTEEPQQGDVEAIEEEDELIDLDKKVTGKLVNASIDDTTL